jgi:hypothetical protein
MRRKHLFEFGDQKWLPAVLREGIQNFLNASHEFMAFYREWSNVLAVELSRPGSTPAIVDLCSGAGGPAPLIRQELRSRHGVETSLTMTDLSPNLMAKGWLESKWGTDVIYLDKPVDATNVPPALKGIRTIFNGFHHLRPQLAKEVLRDAFDQRRPICVFEYNSNSWLALLSSITYPVAVLALMPFARPANLWQWTFTYVVPLLPIIITWDGFVSNLRCYSASEFEDLTADFRSPDYAWRFGYLKKRGYPIGLHYFVGRPTLCVNRTEITSPLLNAVEAEEAQDG